MPLADFRSVQTSFGNKPFNHSAWNGAETHVFQAVTGGAVRVGIETSAGGFDLGAEYLLGDSYDPYVLGFVSSTILVVKQYSDEIADWVVVSYQVIGTSLNEVSIVSEPDEDADESGYFPIWEDGSTSTIVGYTTDTSPFSDERDANGVLIPATVETRAWSASVDKTTGEISAWVEEGSTGADWTTQLHNAYHSVQLSSTQVAVDRPDDSPVYFDITSSTAPLRFDAYQSETNSYGDHVLFRQYPVKVNPGNLLMFRVALDNDPSALPRKFELHHVPSTGIADITLLESRELAANETVLGAAEVAPGIVVAAIKTAYGAHVLHYDYFNTDEQETLPGAVDYIFPTANGGFGWIDRSRSIAGRYVTEPEPSAVVPAKRGSKVVRYTVTEQTSADFTATPRGPNDSVHHGAFKINEDTRSVSARVSLTTTESRWVRPQARFLAYRNGKFDDVSSETLGGPIHLDGTGTWETIEVFASAPARATHWLLDLALFANNPAIDPLTPPDIGDHLYIDEVYVSENGLQLANQPYVDGDQPGSYWTGVPHASPSVLGEPPAQPDPDTEPPTPGVAGSGVSTVDTEGTPPSPVNQPPVPSEPIPGPYIRPESKQTTAGVLISRILPGGLCIKGDVQLGDLLFNTIDEDGVLWLVNDLDGWWTLPEPDIPDNSRGNDDGSYPTRGRYQARVFTLSGSFFPRSPGQVARARDKLIRAANLCHKGAWFATHENDFTRASMTWLSGQPSITTVNTAGRTDFSIGLKAPDPIKYALRDRLAPGWYSTSQKGPGGITVVNEGNTRVSPIIRLTGKTNGKVLIKNETNGQTITVVRILNKGEVLEIDTKNRSVTLNGARNQRKFLKYNTDWVFLDPGSNSLRLTDYGGVQTATKGTLTVEWRHGWIG